MATAPDYRDIALSARPARHAVLLREQDNWVEDVLRIIEDFTAVWGGSQNVLIPCPDEGDLPSAWWRLLERFDPDYLGYYVPTYRAFELGDPDGFEKWLDAQARQAAGAGADEAAIEAERSSLASRDALQWPTTNWKPGADVEKSALRFLAPLEADYPISEAWQADKVESHRVTQMTKLRDLEEETMVAVVGDQLDDDLRLILYSRFGKMSPSYSEALAEASVEVSIVEMTSTEIPYILDFALNKDPARRWQLTAVYLSAKGEKADPPVWSRMAFSESTPLQKSLLKCSWYLTSGFSRRRTKSYLVVGETPSDYCLYLLLDRIYATAVWCPTRFLDASVPINDLVSEVGRHLRELSGPALARSEIQVIVTSASRDEEIFAQTVSCLRDVLQGFDLAPAMEWRALEDLPLPAPLRLYSDGSPHASREPFVDDHLAGLVATPIPDLTPSEPCTFSWHIDAVVDERRYPPRHALNQLLVASEDIEREGVRASSEGISYFSESQYFVPMGAPIKQSVARPKIRIPSGLQMFSALATAAGLRAEISQSGRFTQGIIEIWGGLNNLATDFREPSTQSFLNAFRSTARSGVDPGVYLDSVRRRYLSVTDAMEVMDSDVTSTRDLIDSYLARGILARGLVLICPHCDNAAWYAMQELTLSFTCRRCRRSSLLTQKTWRMPEDEPQWFYELDEVAYQAIIGNIHVPVLTLELLSRESRSFTYAPELDVFREDKRLAELDICAFVGSAIIVGEAKIGDRLGAGSESENKKIGRLFAAASDLTAHEIVVATTFEAWSTETLNALDSLSKKTGIKVRKLANLQKRL